MLTLTGGNKRESICWEAMAGVHSVLFEGGTKLEKKGHFSRGRKRKVYDICFSCRIKSRVKRTKTQRYKYVGKRENVVPSLRT